MQPYTRENQVHYNNLQISDYLLTLLITKQKLKTVDCFGGELEPIYNTVDLIPHRYPKSVTLL